jgi:hypothetical protein
MNTNLIARMSICGIQKRYLKQYNAFPMPKAGNLQGPYLKGVIDNSQCRLNIPHTRSQNTSDAQKAMA